MCPIKFSDSFKMCSTVHSAVCEWMDMLIRAKRRGGSRPGAGRKPTYPGKRVRHAARPFHARSAPLHVTLRSAFRGLRRECILPVFSRAIARSNRVWVERFRIVHYSIQNNHVHLVVEAEDKQALSRGMQGLTIRLARAINRVLRRRGSLWTDRYHARTLTSPLDVRNVLVYVHANFRKHEPSSRAGVDPYSSGLWFDGWQEARPLPLAVSIPGFSPGAPPVAPPRTWLLRRAWRGLGRISWREQPSVQ